jgi:hypothetical protein
LGYEEVLNLADRGLRQAKGNGKDQAIGMIPSIEGESSLVRNFAVDKSRYYSMTSGQNE